MTDVANISLPEVSAALDGIIERIDKVSLDDLKSVKFFMGIAFEELIKLREDENLPAEKIDEVNLLMVRHDHLSTLLDALIIKREESENSGEKQ